MGDRGSYSCNLYSLNPLARVSFLWTPITFAQGVIYLSIQDKRKEVILIDRIERRRNKVDRKATERFKDEPKSEQKMKMGRRDTARCRPRPEQQGHRLENKRCQVERLKEY